MRRSALLLGLLFACAAPGPRPIAYDADQCAQCLMQISDTRFGGEIETTKGKILPFDAVECLVEYNRGARDVRSVWVIDFRKPGSFIPAADAWFVAAENGRSPMGRGLYATATEADAREIVSQVGGTIQRWSDLK